MIELNLDEAATYDFGLEIGGSGGGKPEIRFSITHPTGYALNFPTKVLESGRYQVSLPALRGIFPAGNHACVLEVIMGDRYFKPLTETLKINQPMTAEVSTFQKSSSETLSPVVKVTTVTEAKTLSAQEKLKAEAEAEFAILLKRGKS